MENYRSAISKVLKQIHHDLSLSADAKTNLNVILNRLCEKIVKECSSLMKPKNFTNSGKKLPQKKTLSVLEAETATKLVFHDAIQKHAVANGRKAVANFKRGQKEIPPTERAKLQFPISKTRTLIQKHMLKNDSLGPFAVVYITAILEYVCAEVLELSGNYCSRDHRKRINSTDIKTSIIYDMELDPLISKDLKISLTGEVAANKRKRFDTVTL